MASKRKDTDDSDEGAGGATGQGGSSGTIGFVDFLNNNESLRDDLLPEDVVKRKLGAHQAGHESRVKKQKSLQDERARLKNGKISLDEYRQGLKGSDMKSNYKAHPVFAKSAQFHDPQVNAIPSEHMSQANDELQNKLQNEYQKKYLPEYTPRPQSAPKLLR